MIQLTLTLKMTTAQVVETSVTVNSNSPIQDYVHPDDQTQPFEMTPGFKPFTINDFINDFQRIDCVKRSHTGKGTSDLAGLPKNHQMMKKLGINGVFCLFKVLSIQSFSSAEALLCCNLKSCKWAKRKCIHEG